MKEIQRVKFIPQVPKRKKVAAYCRVSTGKDAMLHSLATQVSFYKDLVQNNGEWEFAGVFYDEAISGTKTNRPGFTEMMNSCRSGNIDMIITKSISRFARNTVTLLDSVHQLKEIGVNVFFEEQNIFSDSPDGELMLSLLAAFAQEESLSASENQKWRVKQAFENGELINFRFMFGYTVNNGVVEINSEQAEIVKEIFERAISGESLTSIAKDLTKRNISCVLGGHNWIPVYIKRILSNEKYTGNALLGKSYRNNHIDKKKKINKGERARYMAEETHPAIIDIETFQKAQQLIQALDEEAAKRKKPERTILSGKVICGHCGSTYKRRTTKNGKVWNCRTYVEQGKKYCPGCSIKEEQLLQFAETVPGDFESITVKEGELVFSLHNGKEISMAWQRPGRKDSWTEEMKLLAAQHGKQRWEDFYG